MHQREALALTQPTDPQERKKDFLDTALKLFNEKGYEKTTFDDIIKAMGVSKGAFYNYFAQLFQIVQGYKRSSS